MIRVGNSDINKISPKLTSMSLLKVLQIGEANIAKKQIR